MSGLLVVGNPKRRRAHTKKRRSVKRNPSRRRRPMTALQRKYFGKRRHTTRRRHVRRNPLFASASTPKRRRRRSRRVFARTRSTVRKSANFLTRYGFDTIVPATIGAGGALALDLAWGYLPIPSTLSTGPAAPAVRLAGAIALGMAATAVVGPKWGRDITAGATVVTIYDLVKGYVKSTYPSLPLQGLGRHRRFGPGYQRMGWYSPGINIGAPRMGEFTPDYVNEATTDDTGIVWNADPTGAGADHLDY